MSPGCKIGLGGRVGRRKTEPYLPLDYPLTPKGRGKRSKKREATYQTSKSQRIGKGVSQRTIVGKKGSIRTGRDSPKLKVK